MGNCKIIIDTNLWISLLIGKRVLEIRTLCSINNTIVSSPLRDVNDLYLLALADTTKADYILTGDKDLLILQSYNQTKIVTYNEFVQLFS